MSARVREPSAERFHPESGTAGVSDPGYSGRPLDAKGGAHGPHALECPPAFDDQARGDHALHLLRILSIADDLPSFARWASAGWLLIEKPKKGAADDGRPFDGVI
jgi:hypothetical protein